MALASPRREAARGKALAGFSGFSFEPELNADAGWDKGLQHRAVDLELVFAQHRRKPLTSGCAACTPKWRRVNELAMCRAMRSFDVVILGAGAAGMMAAIEAGKRGRTVLV